MTSAAHHETTSSWAAFALPLVASAGFVTTLLIELNIAGQVPDVEITSDPGFVWSLNGVVLAVLATIILRQGTHRGFGLAMGWFGIFWTLDGLSESYVRYALSMDEPQPGVTLASWFLLRFTAFLPVTIAILLLLFPTGRLLTGGWGVVSRVALGTLLVTYVGFLVVPSDYADELPPGADPDPTTLFVIGDFLEAVMPAMFGLSIAAFFTCMVTVVARYRSSRGVERDRMRWLLWGVIVAALSAAAGALVDSEPIYLVTVLVGMNVPLVAMTVAVVNPRLVSIEDLLGRTVVYGALSIVIVAVDLAALALLTAALGDALDQRQVVVVALLLSVLIYSPVRSRLWALVRRITLGDRENPYDAVAGLASTLETADEGPEQLAAVAGAVASAFGIGFVSVEVDRAGGERLVATHGSRPEQVRTLPITYRDAEVGRLVLPARGLRSRLSRRDEQLLGDLVRQAATAARTSRLADELQESRERLVVAREEERRRIRRDLHDGLGPSLSGVVFQLESARLLVDRDPAAAGQQLTATSTQVQDIVADVRRLVHDLRPPALDDRGLVGALRQQAERLGDERLAVGVEAGELGNLPAAVEVAAYRIVGEALTNVRRHAAATAASVDLAVGDGHLVVEVADDGVGIPADAEAGVGLVSLRERAAELGGRCEISCPPQGGTIVKAWLPLRRSA